MGSSFQITGPRGASATGGLGCGPVWTPPGLSYKDADEVYVENGTYYPAGYRQFPSGHYEVPGASTAWAISTRPAIEIDTTYMAGSSSGMIGTAKVNSSWYTLFMMSSDPIILALPYIRIDAISYGAPNTTAINPASQADGTTAENGFFVANDAWNTYRLQKISYDAYGGMLFTIADCVNATPDQILITGDQTAYLAATNWLQVCPPAGVDCCEIGSVYIDGSGNLGAANYSGLTGTWVSNVTVAGNKALAAAIANTSMLTAYPPKAQRVIGFIDAREPTASRGMLVGIYYGDSGTNGPVFLYDKVDVNGANRIVTQPFDCRFQSVCSIRNYFVYIDTSSNPVAISAGGTASLRVSDWTE
jgi:hypothetical protein